MGHHMRLVSSPVVSPGKLTKREPAGNTSASAHSPSIMALRARHGAGQPAVPHPLPLPGKAGGSLHGWVGRTPAEGRCTLPEPFLPTSLVPSAGKNFICRTLRSMCQKEGPPPSRYVPTLLPNSPRGRAIANPFNPNVYFSVREKLPEDNTQEKWQWQS